MKGKTPSLMFLQKHSKIGLAYFLIIAFLGVLLRFFSIIDLPINYRFTVHAHSHVALVRLDLYRLNYTYF